MSGVLVELIGDWEKASKSLTGMGDKFKASIPKAVAEEGEFIRGKMVATIEAGIPPPLSPLTAVFGGDPGRLPLASYAQQIVVRKVGDGVFVGIPPGSRRAEIAELQERGASFMVAMSDKQRRFVMAKLREAGLLPARVRGANRAPQPLGAFLTIRIPARPFVDPTLERWAKPADVEARFRARLSKLLGGALGT